MVRVVMAEVELPEAYEEESHWETGLHFNPDDLMNPLPECAPEQYGDTSEPLPDGSLADEHQPLDEQPQLFQPEHFTCPKCGGHYFGRDITSGSDGRPVVLDTVHCNGSSSEMPHRACDWRGVWPPPFSADPAAGVDGEPEVAALEPLDEAKSVAPELPHAALVREAEIEYCNIGMRIEAIKVELKGAKQEQKEAMERLIEIRNSNPANYSHGLQKKSGGLAGGTEPAPFVFDDSAKLPGDSIHLPLGVPMGSVGREPPHQILLDQEQWSTNGPPADNHWRTAPTSSLKFESIKGIGPKTIDEICAKYPTVGDLEDMRAACGADGFKSGLRGIAGIGQVKADAMEERLLDWLAKNRDAAVFASARSLPIPDPAMVAASLESHARGESLTTAEFIKEMNDVLNRAQPDDEVESDAPQPLDSSDTGNNYADKSHPEHGAYQSGREAFNQGWPIKDNPYIGAAKKAWAAGWRSLDL